MRSYQRRLAARILKCGVNRIWADPKNEKIKLAVTRKDVRRFIKEGFIEKLPEKKKAKRLKKIQQRTGSKKGTAAARIGKKTKWFKIIRPQRRLLREYRDKKEIDSKTYRILYKLVKGNTFRSKHHLQSYMKEKGLIK
jgi:large subunit ribosomal protein L19e